MQVGRVVFGPRQNSLDALERQHEFRSALAKQFTVDERDGRSAPHVCGCVGPQPGETKCPCRLRAEAEQGRQMVRDGIVINGVEYDLVPKRR